MARGSSPASALLSEWFHTGWTPIDPEDPLAGSFKSGHPEKKQGKILRRKEIEKETTGEIEVWESHLERTAEPPGQGSIKIGVTLAEWFCTAGTLTAWVCMPALHVPAVGLWTSHKSLYASTPFSNGNNGTLQGCCENHMIMGASSVMSGTQVGQVLSKFSLSSLLRLSWC